MTTELLMRIGAAVVGAAMGSYLTIPFAKRTGRYQTLKIVTKYLDGKIARSQSDIAGRVEYAGYLTVRQEIVRVVMDELTKLQPDK